MQAYKLWKDLERENIEHIWCVHFVREMAYVCGHGECQHHDGNAMSLGKVNIAHIVLPIGHT